jgi:integrase
VKRANGQGSIYRRGDGRWVASLHVRTSTGAWERRTTYGRSRGEVEQKLTALLRRVEQGAPVAPSKLTVAAYLSEWLEQVAARRVRPSTLVSYRHSVERYIVPALGRKRLEKLSAREVRLFLAELMDRGIGARTVQLVHATLRVALEDATREEIISRNVARLVRAPRPAASQRAPLSVADARVLLKSARDDRLYALFVVLVVLGLRRSEALGLRWPDVDLDGGTLQVRSTLHRTTAQGLVLLPPKTSRSRRVVPLPGFVVDAVRSHQDRQLAEQRSARDWFESGFVFTTPIGTPIDPRNGTRLFQEQCKTAGVPVVPLHALRHTCVTLLLELGVPPRVVMEIAGHAALEMTMNVYGHVNLESRREALDKLAGLFDE